MLTMAQKKVRRLSLKRASDERLCSCSSPAEGSEGKAPVKILQHLVLKPAESTLEAANESKVEDCKLLRALLTKTPGRKCSAKKKSGATAVVAPPPSDCVILPTQSFVDGVAVSPKRNRLASPTSLETDHFDGGAEFERLIRELDIDVLSQASSRMLPPPPPPVEEHPRAVLPTPSSDRGQASPLSDVEEVVAISTVPSGEPKNVDEVVECVSSAGHTPAASDDVGEDAIISLTQQKECREDDGVRRLTELLAEVRVARNVRNGFKEQLRLVEDQQSTLMQQIAVLGSPSEFSRSWNVKFELQERLAALSQRAVELMKAIRDKAQLIEQLTSRFLD